MPIKITLRDAVGFKVKGVVNDETGTPQDFEFFLTAKRLKAGELDDAIKRLEQPVTVQGEAPSQPYTRATELLADVITGWQGVRAEDDTPMPYSADALRTLCELPGLPMLIVSAYFGEVAARAKN